ncbi:MAG: ATP-binding protein [Anaerolineae bacterium]|nr:ATP-binding protein [Anaerolineae bacterium]
MDHIRCRKLLGFLEREYEVVRGFALFPDEVVRGGLNTIFQRQVLSESVLFEQNVDILFIEGRLRLQITSQETEQHGIQFKVRAETLKKFADKGGIIVLDLFGESILSTSSGKKKLQEYQDFFREATLPSIHLPESSKEFLVFGALLSDDEARELVPHAIDEEHKVRGGIFNVKVTSDYLTWIHPILQSAYEGVANLLLSSPWPLFASIQDKVVIMGNPSTHLLAMDMFWDGGAPIFGVLNDFGNGCSVTITGAPFLDSVLEAGPSDAIIFISNLLALLQREQRERYPYLMQPNYEQSVVVPIDQYKIDLRSDDMRFMLSEPVYIEESRLYEFKEIKGGNPVDAIKNTADEYVVAFLNSGGGHIYWGIRDADRVVIGVHLTSKERDVLRRVVTEKLTQIQPAVAPTAYKIEFHEVYQDKGVVVPDLWVVEIIVPYASTTDLYFTGGNQAFVKTDAGKKKLSGPELQDEIRRRSAK